jgi:hypothetical protein
MRKPLFATIAVAVMVVGAAGSAVAADDEVTFTIQASGSGLSLAASGATTTIDDGGSDPIFSATSAGSVVGAMNAVTVTDQRGALLAGWSVNVSGEAWANTSDPGVTIPASDGRVYLDAADLPGLVTLLGGALTGMTLTSAELSVGANNLGSAYTLIAGTTPLGNGSVTYTPTVAVTIPADTPAGTYSATVTQTVS